MRTIRHAAVVVTVAVVASGCSVYDDFTTSDFAKQDGEAIIESAGQAMQDVSSVRMTGELRDKGEQFFVDIHVDRDDNCTGMFRFGRSHMDVRRVGDKAWFKGEAGVFNRLAPNTIPPDVLRTVSTKWFPLTGKDAKDLCDFDDLLEWFEVVDVGAVRETGTKAGKHEKGRRKDARHDDLDGRVDVTIDEESDLGGQTVVKLTGRPGGTHDESVWVLSEAPHYVVKVTSSDTSDGGDLSFSEFDQDVVVEAPRRKDVFRS